jgi:hypothetical protein
LVQEFADSSAGQNRFSFKYPASGNCNLEWGEVDSPATLDLSTISAGDRVEVAGGQFFFEVSRPTMVSAPYDVFFNLKNLISNLNQITNPILFFGGLVSLMFTAISMILRKSRSWGLVVISGGIFALVLSRIALLTYVAVSSFPAINSDYAMPAIALLSVAGALAIYLAIGELDHWRKQLGNRPAHKKNS